MSNEMIVINPQVGVQEAVTRKDIVAELMRQNVLTEGHDFGTIPGTDKPTLFKAGAERLCAALHLNPVFEVVSKVERWDETDPLFHYEVRCRLIHIPTGQEVATSLGSCNSREARYRWRWVSADDIPYHLDQEKLKTRSGAVFEFDFAIDKAETTGKYGKPAEYWEAFRSAIQNGTARRVNRQTKKGTTQGWEIGSTEYRIPNDEIFTMVNTFLKIAQKRAFVSAVLIPSNASSIFTVDLEDLAGFGLMDFERQIGVRVEATPTPAPQPTTEPAERVISITGVSRKLTPDQRVYYTFEAPDFDGVVFAWELKEFVYAGYNADVWTDLEFGEGITFSLVLDDATHIGGVTVREVKAGRWQVTHVADNPQINPDADSVTLD